jgi:nucleoside-diphosphate-sugar epimerase
MMTKTILVTGGTGFVAGWCIAELLQRGYAVRTTIRDAAKEAKVRAAIAAEVDAGGRLSFAIADLTRDTGWDAAMAGCDAVLHVASPLGGNAATDRDALVAPARDGTLRVLRAAVAAKVERVVMTSAAATARPPRDSDRISDESIWADPEDPLLDPYRRSKILAERAAWDFMDAEGGDTQFTTILPGAVFGPLLNRADFGSVWFVKRLLEGQPPALMRIGLSVVDVRDLAKAHVDALEAPAAAGERFLVTGTPLWMGDMARILRERLGGRAAKVPTRVLPDFAVKLLARFIAQLRMFVPDLGRLYLASNDKAKARLGFAPRPVADTLADCAESLLAAEPAA